MPWSCWCFQSGLSCNAEVHVQKHCAFSRTCAREGVPSTPVFRKQTSSTDKTATHLPASLPIVEHVSFRAHPGCDVQSVLHGDLALLVQCSDHPYLGIRSGKISLSPRELQVRRSSAVVRISGSAKIYPWQLRPQDCDPGHS